MPRLLLAALLVAAPALGLLAGDLANVDTTTTTTVTTFLNVSQRSYHNRNCQNVSYAILREDLRPADLDCVRLENFMTAAACDLERNLGRDYHNWLQFTRGNATEEKLERLLDDWASSTPRVARIMVVRYLEAYKNGTIHRGFVLQSEFQDKFGIDRNGEITLRCNEKIVGALRGELAKTLMRNHECPRYPGVQESRPRATLHNGHFRIASIVSSMPDDPNCPQVCYEGPVEYIARLRDIKRDGPFRFAFREQGTRYSTWEQCSCEARGFFEEVADTRFDRPLGDTCYPYAKRFARTKNFNLIQNCDAKTVNKFIADKGKKSGVFAGSPSEWKNVQGCSCQRGGRQVLLGGELITESSANSSPQQLRELDRECVRVLGKVERVVPELKVDLEALERAVSHIPCESTLNINWHYREQRLRARPTSNRCENNLNRIDFNAELAISTEDAMATVVTISRGVPADPAVPAVSATTVNSTRAQRHAGH